MNHPFFTGACTALVTPFLNDQINYPLLERLVKRQIEAGITNIVIAGTTGEAATLSDLEKLEMFHKAKEYAGTDARIIAGTGSNNTERTLAMSIAAEKAGADALLLVSPYYNKPTESGLIAHYTAIASVVHIPIILYNVPSRTGLDIPVSVYRQLAQIPNIVGVKEASSDITKITHILSECPAAFSVWCGNDSQIAPAMALGCSGVVSVLSNVLPAETQAMAQAALDGDFDTAAGLQIQLLPLVDALFSEVNPIPVKAAMKLLGYDCGDCRLPLTPISPENQKKLEQALSL